MQSERACPRLGRYFIEDQPLHVVQRGNDRQCIFFEPDDYVRYLGWLGEAAAEARCAIHAYVLMTNHVHLLLTPTKAEAVSHFIISLGRRYVQYVNRTYRRTGTLWDGRYKSSLVQAQTYLLAAQRYIELNPVRAAMVDDPAHYRWTSYRANALGQADARLTPHPLYMALGATAASVVSPTAGRWSPPTEGRSATTSRRSPSRPSRACPTAGRSSVPTSTRWTSTAPTGCWSARSRKGSPSPSTPATRAATSGRT